jgi:hypothetical protein
MVDEVGYGGWDYNSLLLLKLHLSFETFETVRVLGLLSFFFFSFSFFHGEAGIFVPIVFNADTCPFFNSPLFFFF